MTRSLAAALAWLVAALVTLAAPAAADTALDPGTGLADAWAAADVVRDPGGAWTLADARRHNALFRPARELRPGRGAAVFAPTTLWFRLRPRGRETQPWYVHLSAHVAQADLIAVSAGGAARRVPLRRLSPFAAPVASSGLLAQVPAGALADGALYVRVVTRIDHFGTFELRPASWLAEHDRPAAIARLLVLVFTVGMVLALGLLNLVLAVNVRDRTFAWYAAAMFAFGLHELLLSGVLPLRASVPYDALVYLTYLAYLGLVVGFSGALLRLPSAVPALWKLVRASYAFVFLSASAYVVCPNVLDGLHLLAWLDPLAGGAFLVAILASGFALWRRLPSSLTRFYCIAFAGGIVGIVLDASGRNGLVPESGWMTAAAGLGAAWEAVFLAVALSQHIRGEAIRAKELENERDDLEAVALRDSLSGLWNRRAFEERLESEWRRAVRSRSHLALVLIDIDHFKAYNDACGHLYGDEVLARVASVIARAVARPYDFVARYGGEEFVMLLPGCGLEGARAIADAARAAVRSEGIIHPKSEHRVVTVSVGVASIVPESTHKAAMLVGAADDALYAAKDVGRDTTVVARGGPAPAPAQARSVATTCLSDGGRP